MNSFTKLRHIIRYLGLRWLLFRAVYALKLRTGWFRWRLPVGEWAEEPTGRIRSDLRFVPELSADERSGLGSAAAVEQADRILAGRLTWFSRHEFQVGFPPDWFFNPWGKDAGSDDGPGNGACDGPATAVDRQAELTKSTGLEKDQVAQPGSERSDHVGPYLRDGRAYIQKPQQVPGINSGLQKEHQRPNPASEMPGHVMPHWSEIGDFSGGDIKGVWELSRFGLVFPLVRAFAHSGDGRYVEAFWHAVAHWRAKNAPERGVHWKCGQEVALRLIAWTFGFLAFRQHSATTPQREAMLAEMLAVSGQRIERNIGYALSQKNNHGVSEAAGLFTAGVLLARPRWIARGRRLLDSLAAELIYDDGSFSQHSVNYHRLMLHDYLWASQLGQAAGEPLTAATQERVRRAGIWLRTLLCPHTGQAPNLGANDGAHLLDLTDLGYRDFRPTVQAVGLVTDCRPWLTPGPWDELAGWLGVTVRGDIADPLESSQVVQRAYVAGNRSFRFFHFPDGGYAVWRSDELLAVLRCPKRFRHRPGHRDFLHFDLWYRGRNLLRDAGSYSYNCPEPWSTYFGSSAAHNTIRFDDGDPMPKIGRFLHGAWPVGQVQTQDGTVTASYRDYRGMFHRRTVEPLEDGFRITDDIAGRFDQAVLRWRLVPELSVKITEWGCDGPDFKLQITPEPAEAADPCRGVDGWESGWYQARSVLPVLELPATRACRRLVTRIVWNGS